jgi:hypothetical protein
MLQQKVSGDGMQILGPRLRFTYPMTFVPRSGRIERTEYFFGSDSAAVRRIEPNEASAAFRIWYPEIDLYPFLFPRRKRDYTRDFVRTAATLDLLTFEGEIWWPLFHSLPAGSTSGDKLLREIELGNCSRDSLPDGVRSLDVKTERPVTRSTSYDGHDTFCALAQRNIYENFLICGDQAYVRGGVPVYFKNTRHKKTVWNIDVASVAPGRAADQSRGHYGAPGISFDWGSIYALCNGSFWLANEYNVAQRAAHQIQKCIPRIDVLNPGLVRDVRPEIQLDALFRTTRQMFEEPWSNRWNSGAAFKFKNLLQQISEEQLDDGTTTQRRLDALRKFFEVKRCNYDEMSRLRQDFIAVFDRQEEEEEEETLFSRRILDPEDAEALAAIGL